MQVTAEEHAPGTPDVRFRAFTADLGRWWPTEFTWSGEVLAEIGIEPRIGGMCYEIGPHGFRCDWGRVLAWDPPERLTFSWQIGPQREPVPDARRCGEVEVRFPADGGVVLVHRGFERHGTNAEDYAKAMEAQGWPQILRRYAEYLRSQP
ncbi:MAG: ATPase [Hamadaea sp.]|nr:ATPase [Hamadaea sp.]